MTTLPRFVDDILVVIVLYKTTITESISYQSIRKASLPKLTDNQKISLLIVNNGPVSIDQLVSDIQYDIHYIEQLNNPGVSKAYNVAGELAERLHKRWLLLLDQDTGLPLDFWSCYQQTVEHYSNLPIYAPKLYVGTTLASPCGYRFYRGYVLTHLIDGPVGMKGKNVLNSGLLVCLKAFKKVGGYDETVPLYFSDFVFFNRLKALYNTFAVVNVKLRHELSSSDYSDFSTAIYRFQLYCQGARAAANKQTVRLILYFLTVGARSLLMNRRFKTWSFSNLFIKIWLQK